MLVATCLEIWLSCILLLHAGARPIESDNDHAFVQIPSDPDGGPRPIQSDNTDIGQTDKDYNVPRRPMDQVIDLSCPQTGYSPLVIGHPEDYNRTTFRLEIFRGQDVLCSLVEANQTEHGDPTVNKTNDFTNLKPVGRSYNGNNWESAPGDFSRLVFNCNGWCAVRLPRPPNGRVYVLRSSDYGHELRPDDRVARFLERATFGPTKADIQDFTSPEAWMKKQIVIAPSSHREFYRARATDWFYYTWQVGLLHTGPCDVGSRYRSFAVTQQDRNSYLNIRRSPLDANKLILSIGGYIRSVVDGPMEIGRDSPRTPVDIDETGKNFYINNAFIEKDLQSIDLTFEDGSRSRSIHFDGRYGIPRVHFDTAHASYLENLVVLLDNKYKNILTQYLPGDEEVIELQDKVQSKSCSALRQELVGFTNPLKFAIARTKSNGVFKYWIHSPSLDLLDNGLDAPLADGGGSAVQLTRTIPANLDPEIQKAIQVKCSNVPRTFINEDSCQLMTADACSYDEDAVIPKSGKVLVCGSPGEVANRFDPDVGWYGKGGFAVYPKFNATKTPILYAEQRQNVWTEIALHSADQLRQRMAYALSQIMPLNEDASAKPKAYTEDMLTYYDIFVRNAFGNYFDILKEVTYSPLMSRFLTFNNQKSTGFSYINEDYIPQADENYAREIMQLFTIGLVLMNDDGTSKLDSDGNEIATYNNFHISEYAKVFVGMIPQQTRGNIEGVPINLVDPIRILPMSKDHFPKLGLSSQFVGDGYPLCSDLPHQHFLKKGAKYRILGAKANPDFTNEKVGYQSKRASLDFGSSILASILCNKDAYGKCEPQNVVILKNDIVCHGIECKIDEPRSIEIAEELWYEYIRPPCVNQVFYNNGKTIYRTKIERNYKGMLCGNPSLLDAATTCCKESWNGRINLSAKEFFAGERTTFDTAIDRCSEDDRETCGDLSSKRTNDKSNLSDEFFRWLSASCAVGAKVSPEGSIAIVHHPSAAVEDNGYGVHAPVASDTKSFFRTVWQATAEFPTIQAFLDDFDANCESIKGCILSIDGNCLCEVFVEETMAYDFVSDLSTVGDLLSLTTIGAYFPDDATFTATGIDSIEQFPGGPLSIDTIFRVSDNLGRFHYRKNVYSTAKLGDGSLQMRNPVTFYSLPDINIRDAEYELDATLEHYFFHPNVPMFIARRLSQRFGSSNPSPRYIQAVAKAFRTGKYEHFGTNEYGCLEATIAAILLDRESKDHILDADPFQGQLHGPYMRLMRAMRSSEYKTNPDSPFVRFSGDLLDRIGEEPHRPPSIFSFFGPDYVASGRARAANLVAPEAEVLNGPTSIAIAKGFMSLFEYGSSHQGGSFFFGPEKKGQPGRPKVYGRNMYDPAKYGLNPKSADAVVNDLATLLTSGRLSPENREIIKDVFRETLSDGVNENVHKALINAQQLIALSPEFHSNAVVRRRNKDREAPKARVPVGVPYKTVINVMLVGGLDSYNVLVPESCTGTNTEGTAVHDQYLDVRGALAFDRSKGEFDLTISPSTNQPCESFAIHKELPFIKELYDDQDLVFFANAGIINQSNMTKHNWDKKTKSKLFAHDSMQEEVKKIDAYETRRGTGILGRLNDILINKFDAAANSIGIADNSQALRGNDVVGTPVLMVGRDGPIDFRNLDNNMKAQSNLEQKAVEINSVHDAFSGIFGDTWSDTFVNGVHDGERLADFIAKNITGLDPQIWRPIREENTVLTQKFQTLAKMIQTHQARGVDRDTFNIEFGDFDHHSDLKEGLETKLSEVNRNLKRLVNQLKSDGVWNNVVILITSEFGRTLTPNSNNGSDHGWGGNYMAMGGSIKGGRVLGKYPNDFTFGSRLNASFNTRTRFIPTLSWEHIYNAVVEWMVDGFEDELNGDDLDYILPNWKNVINPVEGEGSVPLFQASDLFDVPTKGPVRRVPKPSGSIKNTTKDEPRRKRNRRQRGHDGKRKRRRRKSKILLRRSLRKENNYGELNALQDFGNL